MDKNCECDCNNGDKRWWKYAKPWNRGSSGHIYGLGVIGALFYFLPHLTNFQDAIVGIIKALAWPALLVFKALELLKF